MSAQGSTSNLTRPQLTTLIAFVFVVLLAGGNAVAVRFTVAELAPFWGAAIRFAGAALLFWIIALARRSPLPDRRSTRGLLLFGLLSFGASYAFIYWGIRSIPAGMTQVILALVPLLTILLAVVHGLEALRWPRLLGALIAVAGIALAFFEQPNRAISILPLFSIVLGAACIAEGIVVLKRVGPTDPVMTNAVGMTAGAIMLFAISLLFGEAWRLPTRVNTWLSTLYLVVAGSVGVFYLYVFVIRRWTASAASYQFVLFPFVTVTLGSWLAHETINAAFILGGALVLIGVWIGALSSWSRPAAHEVSTAMAADAD